LTTLARHMYGRLSLAIFAVMAVVAITETLYRTKDLYHLVFAGVITWREVFIVWSALLPVVFYHLGPEMISIALLARYYLWRQHNEVLIMRTMGLSCRQIVLPGIVIGFGFAIFSATMSIWVLPETFGKALGVRSAAAARIAPRMLIAGVPNAIPPNVSLLFRTWLSPDVIDDVLLTQDHDAENFTLVVAQRGEFVETNGSYTLVLERGSEVMHKSARDATPLSFDRTLIPLVAPQPAPSHARGYYEEPIYRLLNPPGFVRNDPDELAAWLTEGHHRIINPLRCIGCTLLLLGVLVPGVQNYRALLLRLGLAVTALFAESSISNAAFILAHRHPEAVLLLYLLPLTSGGSGMLLLVKGDSHISHWFRRPRPWHGTPRDAITDAYTAAVAFAARAYSSSRQ
jgi:lipopolysaccharide export LptBFGC system permease protein LptF